MKLTLAILAVLHLHFARPLPEALPLTHSDSAQPFNETFDNLDSLPEVGLNSNQLELLKGSPDSHIVSTGNDKLTTDDTLDSSSTPDDWVPTASIKDGSRRPIEDGSTNLPYVNDGTDAKPSIKDTTDPDASSIEGLSGDAPTEDNDQLSSSSIDPGLPVDSTSSFKQHIAAALRARSTGDDRLMPSDREQRIGQFGRAEETGAVLAGDDLEQIRGGNDDRLVMPKHMNEADDTLDGRIGAAQAAHDAELADHPFTFASDPESIANTESLTFSGDNDAEDDRKPLSRHSATRTLPIARRGLFDWFKKSFETTTTAFASSEPTDESAGTESDIFSAPAASSTHQALVNDQVTEETDPFSSEALHNAPANLKPSSGDPGLNDQQMEDHKLHARDVASPVQFPTQQQFPVVNDVFPVPFATTTISSFALETGAPTLRGLSPL
jgi:hypothetical protein